MAPKLSVLPCHGCGLHKPRAAFAERNLGRSNRRCKACALGTRSQDTLRCGGCQADVPRELFSADARKRRERRCPACVSSAVAAARAKSGVSRAAATGKPLRLGLQEHPCPHCGAKLWKHELSGFCCNGGKYAIDFAEYFAQPPPMFLAMFRQHWPHRPDQAAHQRRDQTAIALTGFSAVSRMYNGLFCLVVHEVQSSSGDKELRLGHVCRPSNIRIHGTLYRRIFDATAATSVRYLLIDSLARSDVVRKFNLDPGMVNKFEKYLAGHNPYFQLMKPLARQALRCPSGVIRLQWRDDVNELAAVVDDTSASPGQHLPRSVAFSMRGSSQPQRALPGSIGAVLASQNSSLLCIL